MNLNEEKRMAGTYEIIHAFEIGKKEIVIGEDRNASPDERYVVANYENNGIFERYVDALVGNDFAEIAKIFADRIKNESERVIEEISKIEVDTTPIFADGCTVIKAEDSIKNKVNVYDDIKKKLIAKGVPESEIAFIHNADSEAKKKDLLISKVRTLFLYPEYISRQKI